MTPTAPRPVVLVANRGEIAVRVVEAARRIGASPVVAVSAADVDSEAAHRADRAIVVGPAASNKSYLRPELIVQAALHAGADAVHPGYGFLSEQPALAEMLEEHGIAFVGPRPETLRAVGDKLSAREVAQRAGVPIARAAIIDSPEDTAQAGNHVGFPALIKAAHGGGGKGIRLVRDEADLSRQAPEAAAEALASFGRGELYLERFYGAARHVEVQVFGDGEGRAWVLGDRDCSVQRRHQKLIEECPAPHLSDERRGILHDAARALVETLRYRGAGTVEFLADTLTDDLVFLEVNARIQVEHPVTEEAYGIDLVAAQLRLALGRDPQLPDVPPVPHSAVIELRLNVEDPHDGFRPSPGTIDRADWPRGPGIRVDTHVYDGYRFPPYYDSLMAKLIIRAHDRPAAVAAALAAADNTRIDGVRTTLPLHRHVLAHPDFVAGGVSTSWFGPMWDDHLTETQQEPT